MGRYPCINISNLFQYEPIAPAANTILAIYQSPQSAQKLIGASPLQLRLERKDSGWKHLDPDGASEGSKAASEDQLLVSREEATTVPAEALNAGGDSSGSDSAGEISGSLAPKDNTFKNLGGNNKWGSRGPSIEKASPVETSPQLKTMRPDAEKLTALPIISFQSATPQTNRHGQSISTKYREYKLEISPSNMNHRAYIARQLYYGPFQPDTKTIMAADLDGRVPLDGMLDCHMGKGERPLRERIQMKDGGAFRSFSLKELYEKKVSESNGNL
ncbi:MAG: hypothetical protein Q9191_000096 [Dirinaria sp. TL-2023a]